MIWKAHTLLPGFDFDARFMPTIVIRQTRGVLQRRGEYLRGDCPDQCHAEGAVVYLAHCIFGSL